MNQQEHDLGADNQAHLLSQHCLKDETSIRPKQDLVHSQHFPQSDDTNLLESGQGTSEDEAKEECDQHSSLQLHEFLARDNQRFLAERNSRMVEQAPRSAGDQWTGAEYNVLLLGESGAGKSTTINALANYLRFGSFEQAVASGGHFVQLIASQFRLTHPETGQEMVITSGLDRNECHDRVGASSTQEPMAYQFKYADKLVRIIDTPGMGDTRGLVADQRNFAAILRYLRQYRELHAIVILVKANETRQVASFRYCITELLTHLHRNACANIVFCFTFSRNTYYGAGDGFATVQSFLAEELPEVRLTMRAGINCFFIDNEAYRFLVAQKCGYPFTPNHVRQYSESWDRSAEQTHELMQQILAHKPHNLRETFELNTAKELITLLAEPMITLQLAVEENARELDRVQAQIQGSSSQSMQSAMEVRVKKIGRKPLERPTLVCTAPKCTKLVHVPNGRQEQVMVDYATKCHLDCLELNLQANTIGDPVMRDCTVMNALGKCGNCGCSYKKHMYQVVQMVLTQSPLWGEGQLTQIRTQNKDINQTQDQVVAALQSLKDEYNTELNTMLIISGVFSYLLEKYSNTSFSRILEPCLDMLIEQEDRKLALSKSYPEHTKNSLVYLKQEQSNRIESIRKELPEADFKQTFPQACRLLVHLKHSGPNFQTIISEFESKNKTISKNEERLAVDLTKNH